MKHISEILPKALEDLAKDQIRFQILNVFPDFTILTNLEIEAIHKFVEKCTLSDFQYIKDLIHESPGNIFITRAKRTQKLHPNN